MSDDQSSRSQGNNKSWLERISQAFSSGPESVEDVLEILRDAESESIIDTDAMSIIEGAMQVIDMRVDEIMIPRSQMVTVKGAQDPKEFLPEIISSAHSRFPVIGDSQDDVIGVLLAKDLLPLALNSDLNWNRIREILRPPTFVPESKRLNQLLKEFKETRNHMAIVVDEYGDVLGIATLEDILEEIVGEFTTDYASTSPDIIPQDDGTFIIDGTAAVRTINKSLGWKLPQDGPKTLNGLITETLENIPDTNVCLKVSGHRVEVLQIKDNVVKAAIVHPKKRKKRVSR
jgi:magnesium and cobalt transporter